MDSSALVREDGTATFAVRPLTAPKIEFPVVAAWRKDTPENPLLDAALETALERTGNVLFDLDAHIEMMDVAGIDIAVLSCAEGMCADLDKSRLINDRTTIHYVN